MKFSKRIDHEIHEILSYVKGEQKTRKLKILQDQPRTVYFHSVAKFFAKTTRAIVRSSDTFKATTRLVYTRYLTFFGRFHLEPLFWENSPRMEGHDLASQGIGIPLLLHAREGISYLRPSLNSPSVKSDQWSPSLSSFALFFVVSLSPCFSFLSLSLSLLLSRLSSRFNFHWKPRTTGHYPCRRRFQTRSRVQSRISGTKSSWPFRTFKCRETPNSLPLSIPSYETKRRATIRIVWFWRALTEHGFPRLRRFCVRERKPWREINVYVRTRDNWWSGDIRLKSIEVNLETCLFTYVRARKDSQNVSSKFDISSDNCKFDTVFSNTE